MAPRASLVAEIRQRRAILKMVRALPRRRRPPPQQQPDAIRLAYFSTLDRMVSRARALVGELLEPRLRDMVMEADRARGDAAQRLDETAPTDINAIIEGIADRWFSEFPNEVLRRTAQVFGDQTSTFQREQLAKQFKARMGFDIFRSEPWVHARVEQFTRENVALIKSVGSDYFADLEKRLARALSTGQRWEDLAQIIQDRTGVAEGRAKLIARDQVGKLYGSLNETRQKSLGVDKFIWRTMQDNRVRDSHEQLEGQTYSWDDPPDVDGEQIAPGEAVNCRCWGEPDFSALEDEVTPAARAE